MSFRQRDHIDCCRLTFPHLRPRGSRGLKNRRALGRWGTVGKVIGLVADLTTGGLNVTLDGSTWQPIFSSGLSPSEVVGARLFPAVSGCGRARIRVNFGISQDKPLRYKEQYDDPISASETDIGAQVGLAFQI